VASSLELRKAEHGRGGAEERPGEHGTHAHPREQRSGQAGAAGEILAALSARFLLTPADPAGRGSAPAETFLVGNGPHQVSVIGSVTRPFCGACDRVRLTADGQIRNCLFARDESDLRTSLRAGADDDQLAAIWHRAVAAKLPGHGINDPGFVQPARPMSAIGG
jgi:GTP 3',8-cyclase